LQESLRSRDVCARAKEASADEQPDATEKAGEQVKEVETEVAVRAEAGFSGALDDFDDGESDIEYDDHLPFDYDPNAEGDDDELYRDAPAWDEGWEADEAEDEEGEQMQTKQAGEWDDKVVQVRHFPASGITLTLTACRSAFTQHNCVCRSHVRCPDADGLSESGGPSRAWWLSRTCCTSLAFARVTCANLHCLDL
jgi:hypothetical protein